MKYAAVLGFAALAVARKYQNIDIEDFTVFSWTDGSEANIVKNLTFVLNDVTDNVKTTCAAYSLDPNHPATVNTNCKNTDYRFNLRTGSTSKYALDIVHQTGPAAGYSGTGDVPTDCKATNEHYLYKCIQKNPTTIGIVNDAAPSTADQ